MLTDDHIPMVPLGSLVQQAIEEIEAKKIGATLVVDEDKKLVGIICDGDLRRALIRQRDIHNSTVEAIMTPSPKNVDENQTAAEALALMELHSITHLAIVDRHIRVKGILHLHDLLGRERFKLNAGLNCTSWTYR